MAIEKGDSYDWVGMQVAPLTRNIRKEFNIPKRVKGMFVLDEGVGAAGKCGVKTGDVIVSISRRPVPTARAFVDVAGGVQYYEGILLDIYRDGKTFYITVPFKYEYGPLYGPNRGSWQFGAPILGQALPYGPAVNYNNNNRNR
jgi:S1-C subfamily serine protease